MAASRNRTGSQVPNVPHASTSLWDSAGISTEQKPVVLNTHASTSTPALTAGTSSTHSTSASHQEPKWPLPETSEQSHLKKSEVITPVKPDRLAYHLRKIGYDPTLTKYLLDGFTNGFRLGHQGLVNQKETPNHQSVMDNMEWALKLLQLESDSGRLAGPFDSPPLQNFRVSPLKLVPKPKTSKVPFRLVHNLSHPFKGDSINSGIPQDAKSVQYSTILDAIRIIISLPQPVFTAKTDIKNAFKIVPVSPLDHHKLGLKIQGKYYYDRTLSLGTASACQIFESFSTALHAIHCFYSKLNTSVHMLDDFLFIAHHASFCQKHMNLFDAICDDIGVPIAPEKKTTPSLNTVFLGIELDTQNGMAVLPMDKLETYSSSIREALGLKSMTKTELQSLVGKLSFASMVVPARPFLRRLINLMSPLKLPNHHGKLTIESKKDLQTWLDFLSEYNGRTYFRMLGILDSPQLHLYSDSSKLGFGAVFGSSWIQGRFPESWIELFQSHKIHISFLEMYPVFVAISIFGKFLTNTNVLFHSDNQAVVEVLNKQSSKDKHLMLLVRPLVLVLIRYNINLKLKHIPGLENGLPDAISRFQVTHQLLQSHAMKPHPEVIPSHLLPTNFKLQ